MLWALAVGGCAPVGGAGGGPDPAVRFARPLETYRELELITGNADFPAVADVATLAGPADSTLLLFGLSLPTNVLQFQRADTGFAAWYLVSLRAVRDSQAVMTVDRQETVRVHGFAETARTDESVLFQTRMVLAPGTYTLDIRVRDGLSARGFEASDTVTIPAYGAGAGGLAQPVAVHSAAPRGDRVGAPELILNPRHTVPYGGEGGTVYLEAYGGERVRLELRGPRDETVWTRDVELTGGDGMAAGVVTLSGDSLSMGQFSVVAVAGGDTTRAVPLLVTLTDQWMATNFTEVMDLLGYIAGTEELDAMVEASPDERRRLWDAFWEARDPVPATPVNEYRDDFFERIRVATVRFAEPGRPGWRTDRGEVYIVLGPPTRLTELRYDETYAAGRPRAQEWVYERVSGAGRLSLVFVDPNGAGTYRLTQDSEMAFRNAAERVKNPGTR